VLERSKRLVMSWRSRVHVRAMVMIIGVPLAIFSAITFSPAWLTLPLVGVAVAAVTMTVNKIGQRLSDPVCWTCGHDLASEPGSEHGRVCPECGSLNQSFLLTMHDHDDAHGADHDPEPHA